MSTVWFWLLGVMLTVYGVLDGFDLGVGAMYPFAARTDVERRTALTAIGPVWNGNEVWLLAAGGMLVVSYPKVYASGFSGFYLALMIVLWLLIGRGVGIELRSQFINPLWRSFWDAIFWIASLLLTLLLGVALGNVVRGLPIGRDGFFQGSFTLLLNPYSLLVGLLSTVTLAWHGANWLALKTEGTLALRARRAGAGLYWVTLLLVIAATAATFVVRDDVLGSFNARPYFYVLPVIAILALVGGGIARVGARERGAFAASTFLIVGLLTSAAATVYPNLLTSTVDPAYSLSVDNASSAPHGLFTALLANVAGLVAVAIYIGYAYRTFRGKVRVVEHGY